MCEECGYFRCPPACPNYIDTRKSYGKCWLCSEDIRDGEKYVDFGNKILVHLDCVQDNMTAEEILQMCDMELEVAGNA